jgi:hypothetical protein
MPYLIVRVTVRVQAPPMTWEEDTIVERILRLFRPSGNVQQDNEARRTRSNRMRYFLEVFGSTHWAERVDGPRVPFARRGRVAL